MHSETAEMLGPAETGRKVKKAADFSISCTQCLKVPEDKKCFQKCARCKSVRYCSRECQKLDWPFHRRHCCETQPSVGFVRKFVISTNKNDPLMSKLRLAIVHEMQQTMAPTDKSPPDPSTAFWNIALVVALRPCSDADLQFVRSGHTTPEQLRAKEVWGTPRFTEIVDISDMKKYSIPEEAERRFLERWRNRRGALERQGKGDTFVAVLHFNYDGRTIYYTDVDLHPRDIGLAKAVVLRNMLSDKKEWGKPGNAILRKINAELANEEQEGKNASCLLGDYDKNFVRKLVMNAAE